MTITESLQQVFIQNPEVWMTTRKLRGLLMDMYKDQVYPTQVRKGLLELRDMGFQYEGRVLVQFKMSTLGQYYYALTNKKTLMKQNDILIQRRVNKQLNRLRLA